MLPRACHPVTPLLLGYRPRSLRLSQTRNLSPVPGVEEWGAGSVGAPNFSCN